jgi:TatD family hydrolase
VSNRRVLELCERYSSSSSSSSSSSPPPPLLLPALGIYPIDALCHYINDTNNTNNIKWSFTFPQPALFDVDAEINFIETMARDKKIVAIGECGLDKKYYDNDDATAEQERVLRKLMKIGKLYDIPLIIHSRKAEARVLEMLIEEGVVKADFHSFSGDTKLGVEIARHGYYLSIPTVVEKGSSFQSLAKAIPLNKILTETDAPFLSPDKGIRNDPSTIPRGVIAIAKVKKISASEVAVTVRENFRCLFNV